MKKHVIYHSTWVVLIMTISILNIQIVFGEQGGGGNDTQCSTGGPGASYCSISVTVNGETKSCEKTCSSSKYACCYIKNETKPKCKCKKYGNNSD